MPLEISPDNPKKPWKVVREKWKPTFTDAEKETLASLSGKEKKAYVKELTEKYVKSKE